jgi:GGDEF domain-containing protein
MNYKEYFDKLYYPKYNKNTVRKWKMKNIFKTMNKELINSLIIDKYFDIYTRNGFEYVLEGVTDECKIYLIDFDDIRGLNKKIGYKEVNNILKKTFSELKEKYTIGRAFSGDEIFFLTYDLNDDINTIKDVCLNNNLTFTYIERRYKHVEHQYFGENAGGVKFRYISEILEEMINELH